MEKRFMYLWERVNVANRFTFARIQKFTAIVGLLSCSQHTMAISDDELKADFKRAGSCSSVSISGGKTVEYSSIYYMPLVKDISPHAKVTITYNNTQFQDEGYVYYPANTAKCVEFTKNSELIIKGLDHHSGTSYITIFNAQTGEKTSFQHNMPAAVKVLQIPSKGIAVLGFGVCDYSPDAKFPYELFCRNLDKEKFRELSTKHRQQFGTPFLPGINKLGSGALQIYTLPKNLADPAITQEVQKLIDTALKDTDHIRRRGNKSELIGAISLLVGAIEKGNKFGVNISDEQLEARFNLPAGTCAKLRAYWHSLD